MAFDRAKTSLGFIEDRFRKLFNMAGTIDATFAPTITPSVVIADTRDAGYSTFRGRHWAWWSDFIAPAAGQCIGIQFAVPVIVNNIGVTGLGMNNKADAYYIAPQSMNPSTLPVIARTAAGTWIDQRELTTELTPFTDTAAPQAAGAGAAQFTVSNRIGAWAVPNTVGVGYDTMLDLGGLHIGAGGALWFNFPVVPSGNVACGMYGRIF